METVPVSQLSARFSCIINNSVYGEDRRIIRIRRASSLLHLSEHFEINM
jgi:hypothetical protein